MRIFPQFQGKILKPSYNAVDMAEVELMDDGYDARDFSSFLLEVSWLKCGLRCQN